MHNSSGADVGCRPNYNSSARRYFTIFATCAKFITERILADDKGSRVEWTSGPDVGGPAWTSVDKEASDAAGRRPAALRDAGTAPVGSRPLRAFVVGRAITAEGRRV